MPDVRMWLQDVTGCSQWHEAFLLPWSVLCTLTLEMFPGNLHRLGTMEFLMLFEAVLQQALVHPQYLGLYQQALVFLMHF